MTRLRERGYTLVELLVAVVILGTLIVGICATIFFVAVGCKACETVDERTEKITYSECVGSCAQLEGEQAEAECMKRCE